MLERCATTTEEKIGKGTFAQASFVAQDGTEEALDLKDPDFWRKVLGEEAEAQGEEADEADAHGLAGRLSRRNRDAPDRFDPSLDSALSAGYHPMAAGAAGSAAQDGEDGAHAAAAWTRAQLQALWSGLLAFGYGRPEVLKEKVAALG